MQLFKEKISDEIAADFTSDMLTVLTRAPVAVSANFFAIVCVCVCVCGGGGM